MARRLNRLPLRRHIVVLLGGALWTVLSGPAHAHLPEGEDFKWTCAYGEPSGGYEGACNQHHTGADEEWKFDDPFYDPWKAAIRHGADQWT